MLTNESMLQYHPEYFRRSLWLANNHWVTKFIPGVIFGFFSCLLLLKNHKFPSRKNRKSNSRNRIKNNAQSSSNMTAAAAAEAAIGAGENVKLILVVNKGLKEMKAGKMGAQCGHASAMVMRTLCTTHRKLLDAWEGSGQAKITVRAETVKEMEDIASKARSKGILVTLVHDAGKTQIKAGSLTVMAIGPASESQLQGVTNHLKLLS